ncbi:hypothetical protein D4R89_05085 [bacterium]|nr:MAG: hypothetical protein D4R89_05085 [bacterium]
MRPTKGVFGFFSILAFLAYAPGTAAAKERRLSGDAFDLRTNAVGITSLKRPGDAFDTDYIAAGRTLGEVIVRYRKGNGKWQEFTAGRSGERRDAKADPADGAPEFLASYIDRYYTFHSDFNDHYADLEFTERFSLEAEDLIWTLRLRNLGDERIEVGDIALPLPFNTEERWDRTINQTQRVVSHTLVSGHGSFVFWMRPNSVGPYLVMTPLQKAPRPEPGFRPAKLEYYDEKGVYVHAAASYEAARGLGGNWRQPCTSVTLEPRSLAGSEAVYVFKFRWADGYDGVRDVLYDEGLVDVNVVPGMTVPRDLDARLSLRTRNADLALTAEFPGETRIEDLGEKAGGVHLYGIRFSRLGENRLTVTWGDSKSMFLEFFITEPLETLIKKRASFLANSQLHRDPTKWYNGLFSDWDMKDKVLRGPDDLDGLKDYWFASDDPALCKAPYLAEKNVHYPDAREIEALEYHINNFVWGKLQRTDKEKYPYGIYGIPNWKVNRESGPTDRRGWKYHLWRLYDYPHVIMLYLDMYRIAKNSPKLVRYLDKDGYLERAFKTAEAYFTVPLATGHWDAHELTNFNELVISDLIEELEANGRRTQAGVIRKEWEAKVRHFINDDPNIFIAEYPFGPCGFESTHAFAKYALKRLREPGSGLGVKAEDAARFLETQIRANISVRGWLEPAYYLLGSSDPGSLFYMSQMGGWALVDYGLNFAKDPTPYLRLGYASFLSGWALLNSGDPGSGFGYWFPGKENDGAVSGGFVPLAFSHKMGKIQGRGAWSYGGESDLGFGAALRTAATVITEDPTFGWIAYGGVLSRQPDGFEVIPRDGLRRAIHFVRGGQRLHLLLERDGFAAERPVVMDESLTRIAFSMENRTGDGHQTVIRISGLADGSYQVIFNERRLKALEIKGGKEAVLTLPMEKNAESSVIIRKTNG